MQPFNPLEVLLDQQLAPIAVRHDAQQGTDVDIAPLIKQTEHLGRIERIEDGRVDSARLATRDLDLTGRTGIFVAQLSRAVYILRGSAQHGQIVGCDEIGRRSAERLPQTSLHLGDVLAIARRARFSSARVDLSGELGCQIGPSLADMSRLLLFRLSLPKSQMLQGQRGSLSVAIDIQVSMTIG